MIATNRTERNRLYKQRQRLKLAKAGCRKVEIILSAEEAMMLDALAEKQLGPLEGFAKRALIIGACFAANSGTPRGEKVKRASGKVVIAGKTADMSADELAEDVRHG